MCPPAHTTLQVEDKLAKRGWHDELLASGILGVLKAWIEPLPDGNLPNIKVKSPSVSVQSCRAFQDQCCASLMPSQYERDVLLISTVRDLAI